MLVVELLVFKLLVTQLAKQVVQLQLVVASRLH